MISYLRYIGLLLLVLILNYLSSSASHYATVYQIASESVHLRPRYDIILICQDGGHRVANLLPASGSMTGFVLRRSRSICWPNFDMIPQSLAEVLLTPLSVNKRPPYEISSSVSTFTYLSLSVCHSASA